MSDKVSQYQTYWVKLRDATVDPRSGAKSLVIKIHPAWAARMEKALRKRKDEDYNFKMENSMNPWLLSCTYDESLGRLVAKMVRRINV